MPRILIAEDDRTTRYLIRELMQAEGFAVETAVDGVDALGKLKTETYDLILLDIWMPRMNGLELLAHLRDGPGRTRVIITTSDSTPETILQAIREQAYHYVVKPVDPDELLGLVHQALDEPSEAEPIEVISARPHWVELLVPCDRSAAERIQSFMAHLDADLSDEVRHAVGVAFQELLLNAIEWGGKLDPDKKVRIACLRANRMLMYRIADPGLGFNFENLNHAAMGNPPEDPLKHVDVRQQKGLRPGGFGLMMAKSQVDELLYNEAQNEVVFIKYLD